MWTELVGSQNGIIFLRKSRKALEKKVPRNAHHENMPL